jgi:serine/threonine-protein kinase
MVCEGHVRLRQALPTLILFALTGCAADSNIDIREWTLRTEDGKISRVHAPQQLDLLPNHSTLYWLETDVPLPATLRGRLLTLTWPTFAFATLSIDGEELLPLYIAPFDRFHPSRELVFRIPPSKTTQDTLHLKLAVRHVDTWTMYFLRPPRLADGPYGDHETLLARYIDSSLIVGLAAIFLLLSLASAISFLLDRRRAADGWYALLTFCVALWHMGDLGLTQLIAARDMVQIQLLTTPLIAIAGVQFTSAYFKLKSSRIVPLVVIALALLSAVYSWAPFSGLPLALGLTQSGLALLYGWVLLVRAARTTERKLEALCMLGAWSLLGAPVVMSALDMPLKYVETPPFAWLIFVVTQAVLLLRQHAQELRSLNLTLEGRVVALEDRNREVNRLNEELRQQIHVRSARLAEALSRIGRLSSRQSQPLAVGALVGERYKIIRALGQGGMGAVFEVERIIDKGHFALKTLLQADSGAWLARLAREAQVATTIVHPNVVGIVDIDIDPAGIPFIVMELVQGEPLSALQSRFGDAKFAREVLRQIAAGLSALHQAGIVHRDLKPANVLDGAGSPANEAAAGVLHTDGFAAFVRADDGIERETQSVEGLTRTGWMLGTPLYMAPELVRGVKDAPASSDIWSFGVVAYQIACGRLPFVEPPVNWAGDGAWRPPPVDTQLLVEPLRGIVDRCLDVNPSRRPTAAEVATALA